MKIIVRLNDYVKDLVVSSLAYYNTSNASLVMTYCLDMHLLNCNVILCYFGIIQN